MFFVASLILKQVKQFVAESDFGSCTTDGWRDKQGRNYISLTYHFLLDWEFFQLTLRCAPFDGSSALYAVWLILYTAEKSAKNLGNFYVVTLREHKVYEKTLSICTDGAPNETNAVRKKPVEKPNPVCCAHSLNNDVRPHGIDMVSDCVVYFSLLSRRSLRLRRR